ncbi:hypothetical protein MLD38_004030 [Melastoma candidum]|uniref:Uncharacterized protein n=1 Tax=Melastoma candidum TaxID=119954 RepID=A0ACB9SCX9_9MYRT|nr:hypothetical protein MLD38_004030 [Melastoma candidum]
MVRWRRFWVGAKVFSSTPSDEEWEAGSPKYGPVLNGPSLLERKLSFPLFQTSPHSAAETPFAFRPFVRLPLVNATFNPLTLSYDTRYCGTKNMSNAAVKEATLNMDENDNIFRSCLEADRHVSFLTAFEEEEVVGQHPFLGTACSRDLDSGHLAFGTYELPNCFGVENFSSGFEYEEMTLDQDAVDSTIVADKKAKTEISDVVLQETDGRTKRVEGSPACLSGKCDNEVINEAVAINNGPSAESFVGQTSSPQSESPEGRDYIANEQYMHPESCTLTECGDGREFSQLDQMTVRKLQDAFKKMFGRETKIRDKQWLKRRILFGIRNSGEVHKPSNSEVLGASFDENDGKSLSGSATDSSVISPCSLKPMPDHETKFFEEMKQSTSNSSANSSPEGSESCISLQCKEEKDSDVVKVKRVHKPPRRYIEETIEVKPQRTPKKPSISYKRPREKLVDDKILKPQEEKVDRNPRSLHQSSFDGCIQVPFGLPVEDDDVPETPPNKVCNIAPKVHHPTVSTMRREPTAPPGKLQIISKSPLPKLHVIIPKEPPATRSPMQNGRRQRKHHDVIIPKEEPVTTSPIQKGTRRRKHHISWTLSEVMRLIEGVSHLGVGRWSKIKRLLFATSKHRTSVDLKDKWRNLVKASAHLRMKKKGMQARKPLTHQAPESVLRRVQELADCHE